MDDLPIDARRELVGELQRVLEISRETAEDLARSAEPLWDAMERAGGLVDSWGGGEFCEVLPQVMAFIRDAV